MAGATKKRTSATDRSEAAEKLLTLFKQRAPAEDLDNYDPTTIEATARLAAAALKNHRRGDSVVQIETSSGLMLKERPVTVITVVNAVPVRFDPQRDRRKRRRSQSRAAPRASGSTQQGRRGRDRRRCRLGCAQ
jgi:hypothetical protein